MYFSKKKSYTDSHPPPPHPLSISKCANRMFKFEIKLTYINIEVLIEVVSIIINIEVVSITINIEVLIQVVSIIIKIEGI